MNAPQIPPQAPDTPAHRTRPAAGVLLINLGTPDAPTPSAIRRYLAEFLSDRRVVDLPAALWLPILHGLVLTLRPRRLAAAYAQIWTADGSPLRAISGRQLTGVAARLAVEFGGDVKVALGMTYGEPGIADALSDLERHNVRRLVVLPLFPQYSSSATGAAYDALGRALRTRLWVPELRTIASYHDDPAYIEALAASVRRHWRSAGTGDHLLLSFHGIPQQSVLAGDPYYCQCHKTARLLAEALGLAPAAFSVAFQSRFGRLQWIRPYTDEVLTELAGRGIRRLDVICPGFSADCLETLEEVRLRYAEAFVAAGGEALRYIPALNNGSQHLDSLAEIAARHLRGWLPAQAGEAELGRRRLRATALAPMFAVRQ
jgi:ferrochelatase